MRTCFVVSTRAGTNPICVAAFPGRSGPDGRPAVRRQRWWCRHLAGSLRRGSRRGQGGKPRLYYGVMPKATVETVDHVARLARLYLTDAERELFARQLADILAYAESIQALDTAAVEPMSHALTAGSLREDEVREGLPRETVLGRSARRQGRPLPRPARARRMSELFRLSGRRDPAAGGRARARGGGGGPGAPRPHRRRRAEGRRLPAGAGGARPRPGPPPGRGARPGRAGAASGRRPHRAQGRARPRGPAHHLRLAHPRGLPAALHRDRGRAPGGGGRHRGRQDEHGRVRDGLVHREQRLQEDEESLGPRRASPAAPREAPRPRWRRGWSRSPWAPTRAARSASPPRSAVSWA